MNNELLTLINEKFQAAVAAKYGDAPLASLEETSKWVGPGTNDAVVPLRLFFEPSKDSALDGATVYSAMLSLDYWNFVKDQMALGLEWKHHSVEVEMDVFTEFDPLSLIWRSRDAFPPLK